MIFHVGEAPSKQNVRTDSRTDRTENLFGTHHRVSCRRANSQLSAERRNDVLVCRI